LLQIFFQFLNRLIRGLLALTSYKSSHLFHSDIPSDICKS
jgi:hypothetical protein